MKNDKGLTVIPCGVALIRRGREFLIAQRKEDDSFGSFWEFPGGKKEADETFEECVTREIKEELGVVIRVERKFMEMRRGYGNRTLWLNFFLCSHVSGEPRPLESKKVLWVVVVDLKNFAFPPANEEVIRKLLKDL